MALLSIQLRAFSLIEVLVAMVIIMFVFGMAMAITLNVFASNGLERHLQARLALDAFAAETIQMEQFEDGAINLTPYKLERTISTNSQDKRLVKMTFVVKGDDEKVLLTEERWIWLP